MYQDIVSQKQEITKDQTQIQMQNTSIQIDQKAIIKNTELQINLEGIQTILNKYLSYEDAPVTSKKHSCRTDLLKRLKKPSLSSQTQFNPLEFVKERYIRIMTKAYHRDELKLSQFEQLGQFFKLGENKIKLMNYLDPVILQTLRYAIFNRQQIPNYLVKVVNEMAKTNFAQQWQVGYFIIHQSKYFKILCEGFEPPLDLYVELVDSNLIKPNQEQLKQVFTRNQFLFKLLSHNKEFYPTVSQKKRLIFNQFPYLLDIFSKIINIDPASYDFGGLKIYLNTILRFLEYSSEDFLLQRYLPEIKCLYLKIKSNLNISDIQFLFVTLKSVHDLTKNDFKILYHTKPNKSFSKAKFEERPWKKFNNILELSERILTDKNFHLNEQHIELMSQIINYESCNSKNIIKMNLIILMLKQQSYNNQKLPKSIIENVAWVMKNIPDRKIKKQCCYILLSQYPKLFHDGNQKGRENIQQYNFTHVQLDCILEEGRQIALDLLLIEQDKNLTLDQQKCISYVKIVKMLMKNTTNKVIRTKTIRLYQKLNNINQFKNKQLLFKEDDILESNQLVELLEMETKIGRHITPGCIKNILKILLKNQRYSIRKSCLTAIKYIIKNYSKGQQFPQKFQEIVPQFIRILFYQPNMPEDCQLQMVKVMVEFTNLPKAYATLDILAKFLMQVYLKSSTNTPLQINSSFGLYLICINFKSKSGDMYEKNKQFLDTFSYNNLRTYKNVFFPKMKASLNILCAIVALAKNQIMPPPGLAQQLTKVGLWYKQYTKLILITMLFYIKNLKYKIITEKCLINICKILRDNKNTEKMVVEILYLYWERQQKLPNSVINKIKQLTMIGNFKNNERILLCKFYKKHIQTQFQNSQFEQYWLAFKNSSQIQLNQKLYVQLSQQCEIDLEKRICLLQKAEDCQSYRGDLLDIKVLGLCFNVRVLIQTTQKIDYIDNIQSEIVVIVNVQNFTQDQKLTYRISNKKDASEIELVDSIIQIFTKVSMSNFEQTKTKLLTKYTQHKEKPTKILTNCIINHKILQKCGLYTNSQIFFRDLVILMHLNTMIGRQN